MIERMNYHDLPIKHCYFPLQTVHFQDGHVLTTKLVDFFRVITWWHRQLLLVIYVYPQKNWWFIVQVTKICGSLAQNLAPYLNGMPDQPLIFSQRNLSLMFFSVVEKMETPHTMGYFCVLEGRQQLLTCQTCISSIVFVQLQTTLPLDSCWRWCHQNVHSVSSWWHFTAPGSSAPNSMLQE